MPRRGCVHAEGANHPGPPPFPQPAVSLPATQKGYLPGARSNPQSCGISCAQTAIIPMKRAIEAKAAASSMKIFNMNSPPHLWNIRRTSFPFCSAVSSPGGGAINRLVKGFVFDGARPISPLDEPVWTGRLRRLLVWISAWLGIGVTTTRSHFVVHHLTGPPAERPDVATITG